MVFNTVTVGTAVTPAVVDTLFAHYLSRKTRHQKPTAHLSYDEGLALIRKFLLYASHHTVEDLQRFTSQWVPHPRWVKVDEVTIDEKYIASAAEAIQAQLGGAGIAQIGGKTWWQWRRPKSTLAAEWIEMRSDYHERKKNKDEGKRVMLYVHGGAYFFGSVDEHRYQMQRHARKLKARVFAPRYRLAPQFPFPCGLHDCLAAYMYLLTVQDPSTIILAGDSAGGGMVLSLMVILRDRGIPLPAGAILISPWVDLTHSFPSVAQDSQFDYIPPHGFHQRPSASWPPPNADDLAAIKQGIDIGDKSSDEHKDAVRGFSVDANVDPNMSNATAATGTINGSASLDGTTNGTADSASRPPTANTLPKHGKNLSIMLDGKLVEIKDQIQMYASNQLISHPLVSPVLQPSLGGLPPMMILVGGGEMLRDEQIYVAHKAANPELYPPGDAYLDAHPGSREQIKKYKPTPVQLQVWDDLCHVAPTLSFTRPAKYMYRSIAQFGAWALAHAQKTEIDIPDDDDISIISTSDTESDVNEEEKATEKRGQIGKAGDPLPAFKNHMIRQRVDRHGIVFPLAAPADLPGCSMAKEDIGVIKPGPVRKWMAAKMHWDTKYASTKRKVQRERAKEMAEGYFTFGDGEIPPPSALAGRIKTGQVHSEPKKARSWGMSLWALWGSQHDKDTMVREEKIAKAPGTAVSGAQSEAEDRTTRKDATLSPTNADERPRSRRRTVVDNNQTGASNSEKHSPGAELLAPLDFEKDEPVNIPPELADEIPQVVVRTPTAETLGNQTDLTLKRPKIEGVAFPFTVKKDHDAESASMLTLTSATGVPPVESAYKDAGTSTAGHVFTNGKA